MANGFRVDLDAFGKAAFGAVRSDARASAGLTCTALPRAQRLWRTAVQAQAIQRSVGGSAPTRAAWGGGNRITA